MSCNSQVKFNIEYPTTKKIVAEKQFHGVTVSDNYNWLENVSDSDVKKWVKQQDSTTLSFTRSLPNYDKLKAKVANLMKYSGNMDLPVKIKNTSFYLKDDEKGKWGFYLHKENEEPIAQKIPFNPRAIYFYVPSPDLKNVALGLAGPGGYFDWKVFNIETQQLSKETLKGSDMGRTRLTWLKDGSGFYYISSNKIAEKRGPRSEIKVKYHALNTPYEKDKIVYTPESDGSKFQIDVSDKGNYLIIAERNGADSRSKVKYFDLKNSHPIAKNLIGVAEASYIFLGNDNSTFYFETDLNTPKGKIVSVNVNESKKTWKDLIIEKDESIMGYQYAGGTILPLISGNKLVIPVQKDLKIALKVYSLNGKFENRIELPSGGLYFNTNGFNSLSGNRESLEVLTRFIGITEPNTIFKASVNSKETSVFSRAKTAFNGNDYKSEIVFATSKDGTKVPISITYKKGTKLNGKNPLMMQVYGAMAFTNYPYFQADYMTWLDMGGIHAIAHVRGGGAYGAKWHKDGIARNKQNGVDDYISAIEWVIKNKYSSPQKIALNGVSAGTILVGAVLTQKPDLIGAAVSHYGMLDMVGYEGKFTGDKSHAGMIPEIGKASDKEDFKVLNNYSPYLKINAKKKYPAVLALTSEMDTPLDTDSYKFIAKLQNTKSKSPMLLQMAWGSQHAGFGSRTHSPVDTFADQTAFLIKVLNIDTTEWLK